jgi:hypothetical protein
MTESEKSQIRINYWLLPLCAILIFAVYLLGYIVLLHDLAYSLGLYQGLYFHLWHFQLFLWGEERILLNLIYLVISGTLAGLTTTFIITSGPQALSILNKKRHDL